MPGGGDCEGGTVAIMVIDARGLGPVGRKSSAMPMGVTPATTGLTVAGGIWGRTVQQLALRDSHGMLICMQQLWVACWAGSTQVPMVSSSTPSREMATAVRWRTLRNMVSAYHLLRVLP